jgi:hypothetical protein
MGKVEVEGESDLDRQMRATRDQLPLGDGTAVSLSARDQLALAKATLSECRYSISPFHPKLRVETGARHFEVEGALEALGIKEETDRREVRGQTEFTPSGMDKLLATDISSPVLDTLREIIKKQRSVGKDASIDGRAR